MRSKEFMEKDVYAENEKIGRVKEIEINPEDWKVTHLEIELEKDAGVRNMLDTSALKSGVARWTDKGLNLEVPKAQLHAYLKPV
jgi:sporulation protein YlmC with PRC-barrel domain